MAKDKTAAFLVNLARIAYWNKNRLEKYLKMRYPKYRIIEKENDFAFVVQHKGKIIVSIAGTNDLEDVLTDINFFPKRLKDLGWLHRGFHSATMNLYEDVKLAINELRNYREKTTIYLTGHSLGGAIATIMGAMLKQEGFIIDSIYTFGAPKSGKRSFKEYFKKNNIRCIQYALENDPVPKVPRTYMLWRHPGYLITLKNTLVKHKKCILLWFGDVSSHGIRNYYKILTH